MKEEDLNKLYDSIKEKIGEEASGLIADDLGILFTQNKEVQERLSNQERVCKKWYPYGCYKYC